jgi:hypothetical protein
MSWQNEMVRILRFLINDIYSATYEDCRLEETLLVAAQLKNAEIDFDRTYSIDVDSLILSPDPTESTPKDDWFINIVCLAAASIILHSEAKTLAAQAYRIKDGPSSIEIGGAYEATKELADEMSAKVEISVMRYKAGDSVGAQAILTPYTQDSISGGTNPRNSTYFM